MLRARDAWQLRTPKVQPGSAGWDRGAEASERGWRAARGGSDPAKAPGAGPGDSVGLRGSRDTAQHREGRAAASDTTSTRTQLLGRRLAGHFSWGFLCSHTALMHAMLEQRSPWNMRRVGTNGRVEQLWSWDLGSRLGDSRCGR
ncbi:PREDICTED: uncharacterized protein LOC106146659 isoform X6 [Chinchilla lanigera]|uniref:uncharacterized protein LOC106146659 isoform X6 n=1 Tax=Chinchilla lanigera TaxID=34839 RepID=UPI0006985730|nr:PREDICTED: uncharacterized protein LOC106146659 isoform X6 [Chinchilla lanigera]